MELLTTQVETQVGQFQIVGMKAKETNSMITMLRHLLSSKTSTWLACLSFPQTSLALLPTTLMLIFYHSNFIGCLRRNHSADVTGKVFSGK